jgi:hypothetical protein
MYASDTSFFSAFQVLSLGTKDLKGFTVASGRSPLSINNIRLMLHAIACLITTLSTLRGPTIQKSSTLATVYTKSTGFINLAVAQNLNVQTDPLGVLTGQMDQVSYLSPNFTEIVGAFTTRANIYIDTPGVCGNNCTAVVQVIQTPLEILDLADMVSRDLDPVLIAASPKLRSMATMPALV